MVFTKAHLYAASLDVGVGYGNGAMEHVLPYVTGAMQDLARELLRIRLPGTSVNKPLVDVPNPARWHHA
jgi:hypothetical protein